MITEPSVTSSSRPIPAPTTELRLFDELDLPWIAALLDLVTASLGQPWRVLLERIDHCDLEIHPSRVDAIVRALRRVTGGKAERMRVARAVRTLVLGHPALDRCERDARLAAGAAQLGLPPEEIESLLWADLALERPVALPHGRPLESSLVAHANLDRIQRAVRRARSLRLRVWDQAHELVRTIARYGLIAHVHLECGNAGDSSTVLHAGETVLEVTGPLSLFHATTVYGSALAQLVPLLAEQTHFTLDVVCEFDGIEQTLRVEPPVRLPAVRAGKRSPTIAERLARDLERAGREVDHAPPPLVTGGDLLFPDLALVVDGERHLIEVVGFSTAEYLAYKLERYASAGAKVTLCVDLARSSELLDHECVFAFEKRVDATKLLESLGAESGEVTP